MRLFLIALLAAIALAVAGLAALPWLTPQNFARERLETILARSDRLSLEEADIVRLFAFPRPGFQVENVILRQAWAPSNVLRAKAERVFIAVDPLSLFARRVRIDAVEIDGVQVIASGGANDAADRNMRLERIELRISQAGPDTPVAVDGVLKGADVFTHSDVHIRGTRGTADESGQDGAPFHCNAASDGFSLTIKGNLPGGRSQSLAATVGLEIASRDEFGPLRGARLDGRLAVASDTTAFTGGTFSAPGMSARIEASGNGRGMTTELRDLTLHGGRGQGRITYMPDAPGDGFRAEFTVSGVDALALTKTSSGFDWISGTMDIALKGGAPGASLYSLAGLLTGEARVSVRNGAIEGLDLPGIVADVRDGHLRKWQREPDRRTAFDNFAATFQIGGGAATTSDMALNGPDISATGAGSAAFAKQKLDFRLKAQVNARGGTGTAGTASATPSTSPTTLVVPLHIKGHWNKPSIQPDMDAMLNDGASLKSNLKLLGKSIENLTGGQIKQEDLGNALDAFLGKKKTKKKSAEPAPETSY